MAVDPQNAALTEAFFRSLTSQYKRCLAPGEKCQRKPIRAHSIQNRNVLEALVEDGHVMMFECDIDISRGPQVDLRRIGRNKATTFTGLCSVHDTRIFGPIEKAPIDVSNPQHLFLLSYRSVLKEFHAKLRGAILFQKFYREAITQGRAPTTPLDPVGIAATLRIAESYSFYRFKFEFDQWYLQGAWNNVESQTVTVPNTGPVIAVSAVYNVIDNMAVMRRRLDPEGIILNVFPEANDTRAVFSYKTKQRAEVLPHLQLILTATGYYQRYLISKTILSSCENFILSPRWYAQLTEDQLDVIKQHFVATIFDSEAGREDPGLLII